MDFISPEDLLSARFTESIVDAVKEKINDQFIRQSIRDILSSVVLGDGEGFHKQSRVNGENFNISAEDPRLPLSAQISSLTLTSSILEKANLCVTKLFDNTHGYLGSFVYIHERIGICAFHCILLRRRILDGSSLSVADGRKLRHLASYPYYDLSLYEVISEGNVSYLDLGSDSAARVGTKIFVAAFPALDANSSKSPEEEVLISPGKVVRMHSTVGSMFAAGAYECCRGSSGGAVLDKNGKLLGLHIQNLYALDDTYYDLGLEETKFPEDYVIKAPTTNVRFFKTNDIEKKFKQVDPLTLARHAVSNISEKSSFGCFLPVAVIRKKLESCLLWDQEKICAVDDLMEPDVNVLA